MTANEQDREALGKLEERLRILLPDLYQDTYEDVQPVSMGSADLLYDRQGRVAWNKIWGSFCDLAMAGGPPHKGALLMSGDPAGLRAQSAKYREVIDEVCRGIGLVSGLAAEESAYPGWILVECTSRGMAGWLARAAVMENVDSRVDRMSLYLPADPQFRLEKEIKNVVTVVAKTCHYWVGHTSLPQRRAVTELLATLEQESPLIQPPLRAEDLQGHRGDGFPNHVAQSIQRVTGLTCVVSSNPDWVGVECRDVRAAIWMMRALAVANVFARREGTVVFVAVNPMSDPEGAGVLKRSIQAHRLGVAKGIFPP